MLRSRLFLKILLFCTAIFFIVPFGLVTAKEVEVTNEWQLLGENDTIPAGMHVRIDMTTGEKWVKLLDDEEESEEEKGGTNTNAVAAAIIRQDGSILRDGKGGRSDYDYEMMHRTLSKLPDEEKERMGGIPELPDASSSSSPLTSAQRRAFERRMAEIWQQRQQELKELQAQLLDVPEILKQRVIGIREYLKSPLDHLKELDLQEKYVDEGVVTNIISLLEDLEFQLTDVDNARDFHTLGGWDLLVSMLDENVHLQNNTAISDLTSEMLRKIRKVQAYSAWTVGTAVKNSGEFTSFAVEPITIGVRRSTALDLLMDAFCKNYDDPNVREVQFLLTKSIYAIGALLRGNRLSQAHLIRRNGIVRLSETLQRLILGNHSPANIKLTQRLLSLASDLVQDCVLLHEEESASDLHSAIIAAFTSSEWCDLTSTILQADKFLPIPVQETLLQTTAALVPHCTSWNNKVKEHTFALERMQKEWEQSKGDLDPDHFHQLVQQAKDVTSSLNKI